MSSRSSEQLASAGETKNMSSSKSSEPKIAGGGGGGGGVVKKGAKPIDWTRYKVGSKFALIATLAAAIGQSFLFGLNIGLLNASISVISWDLWPCDTADLTISDECLKLLDLSGGATFDLAQCNPAEEDRDPCKYHDEAGDEQECTAPSPVACDNVTWKNAILNCCVFLGAAIASLSSGGLISIGRRKMNFVGCVVYLVGIVSSTVAGSYPAFLWARLIVGLAVGMGSVLAPTYIAEMTPTHKKGSFGVFHQLFITVGILVSVTIGLPFKYVQFDSILKRGDGFTFVSDMPGFNEFWWRFMMGVGIIPLLINVALFMYVRVDTPKYYLEADRKHDAHECLKRVYGSENVDEEFINLVKAVEDAEASKRSGMTLGKAFKNPQYRKVILIGMTTSAFQQFSGINVLMAASNQLYSQAGVSYKLVTVLSTVLSAINMLCTFPAPYLIEKLGRKSLLLIGAIFQTIGFVVPCILLWIDQDADYTKWTAIVGSYVFDVAFAVSTGPVLWVWMTEIFPFSIAAVATGLLVGANWVSSIIMVFIGTALTDNRYSFTIFSVLNVLGIFLVVFLVKETKGYKAGHSPYITN